MIICNVKGVVYRDKSTENYHCKFFAAEHIFLPLLGNYFNFTTLFPKSWDVV